ncbi:MAG: hypothetical protein RAO75_06410 [Candidatus Chlorobium antarcticum]|jgi:hypothetical protein|nr:hypothetical protein [Candidatus Chlorobium antarcticum]
MSTIANYSYRFFYPLELLTWVVIAYGISQLIAELFTTVKPNNARKTRAIAKRSGQWLLLGLAGLFMYNAVHQKADHNYYFKFYNPVFMESDAMMNYLQSTPKQATCRLYQYDGNILGAKKSRIRARLRILPLRSNHRCRA